MTIYDPESGFSPDPESDGFLILDYTAYRAVWNKVLLFINHPMYGILLQQPELTKMEW